MVRQEYLVWLCWTGKFIKNKGVVLKLKKRKKKKQIVSFVYTLQFCEHLFGILTANSLYVAFRNSSEVYLLDIVLGDSTIRINIGN